MNLQGTLLLNKVRVESDLDSPGRLDIAEELIEQIMEHVFYCDVAQKNHSLRL
ncbi:hypothetical protein [Bacillus rugosus]|uniref:hypothetical protein n=1 Tax=Bacillus rugosus TaxID=2715209 RepID=UPI00398A9DE8